MSNEERESMIEWLYAMTGYGPSCFKDWSDEKLTNYYYSLLEKRANE
ncbi:BH0509 family protein [Fictibacillus sp. Mic-4]